MADRVPAVAEYALPALFIGLLFLAIVIVWYEHAESLGNGAARVDRKAHAATGEARFDAFFGTLLSVTLLLAPARRPGPSVSTKLAAASCICS